MYFYDMEADPLRPLCPSVWRSWCTALIAGLECLGVEVQTRPCLCDTRCLHLPPVTYIGWTLVTRTVTLSSLSYKHTGSNWQNLYVTICRIKYRNTEMTAVLVQVRLFLFFFFIIACSEFYITFQHLKFRYRYLFYFFFLCIIDIRQRQTFGHLN